MPCANSIGLFQCEFLHLLGVQAKGQLNNDLHRSGHAAATFMADREALSLALLDIESQVSYALESDTNVTELVNALHLNSLALDGVTMPSADEINIKLKSVKFVGK